MSEVLDPVENQEDIIDPEHECQLVMMNMTGDIVISFDDRNAEKIKEMVRKKMAEGYVFFTMRKVVVEAVQIKRKLGAKGVDKMTNLVIDDATFDKLVKDIDDADVAKMLVAGDARLSKMRAGKRSLDMVKRAKTPEEVVKGRNAFGMRRVVGG